MCLDRKTEVEPNSGITTIVILDKLQFLIFDRKNIYCVYFANALTILLQSSQKHILTLTITFEQAAEAPVCTDHRGLIFGEHIILFYSH